MQKKKSLSEDTSANKKENDILEREYGILPNSKYRLCIEWEEETPWIKIAGSKLMLAKKSDRKDLLKLSHQETEHGSFEKAKEWLESNKSITWPQLLKDAKRWTRTCKKCHARDSDPEESKFISTTKKLEIVGMYITSIIEDRFYIVCLMDYFSRVILVRAIEKRESEPILKVLQEWCETRGVPKSLLVSITRKSMDEQWNAFMSEKQIAKYSGPVSRQKALRRVKRAAQLVLRMYKKENEEADVEIRTLMDEIEKETNKRHHNAVGMSPYEAWNVSKNDNKEWAKLQKVNTGNEDLHLSSISEKENTQESQLNTAHILEVNDNVHIYPKKSRNKGKRRSYLVAKITQKLSTKSYVITIQD